MRLRRALGIAAAGVGATALANRVLASRAGPLEPPLSGDHGTFRWHGMDVAYTDAGDPDDPDLVLLHGINAAGSSGEFRAVFDALAADYHVVAPDLPGFGCSDRPELRYSAALYEDFLADFLAEFETPGVVVSSLTTAYLAAVAADVPISGVVAVCPTASATGQTRQWVRELFRSPLLGTALFNLLASKPSIRHFNADHGYYRQSSLSPEWMDYEWRTAHQPGARFAPASFLSGHLDSEVDLGGTLGALDAPVTFVWGREADITPLAEGRRLADAASARLVVFDDAMLLPHVEYPSAFVETVREEL